MSGRCRLCSGGSLLNVLTFVVYDSHFGESVVSSDEDGNEAVSDTDTLSSTSQSYLFNEVPIAFDAFQQ